MDHLRSDVAGMRAAAATTCRNICIEDDAYRKQFVDCDGIGLLVAQLGATPDPALNWADVQLEAILNIEDMLEQEDGTVIVAYAKKALVAGADVKLRKLVTDEDDEVRGAAEEVLSALAKVANGGR